MAESVDSASACPCPTSAVRADARLASAIVSSSASSSSRRSHRTAVARSASRVLPRDERGERERLVEREPVELAGGLGRDEVVLTPERGPGTRSRMRSFSDCRREALAQGGRASDARLNATTPEVRSTGRRKSGSARTSPPRGGVTTTPDPSAFSRLSTPLPTPASDEPLRALESLWAGHRPKSVSALRSVRMRARSRCRAGSWSWRRIRSLSRRT